MSHTERYLTESDIELHSFDSLADMVDTCGRPAYGWNHGTSSNGNSWLGRDFKTWDEVCAAAHEPWQEGAEFVESMSAELSADIAPPRSRKRRRCWSADGGDDICLDRLRSGQDYWRSTRRELRESPATLDIVCDLTTQWTVDAMDSLWRGVAAIVLCRKLEAAGYRVALHLVSSWRLFEGRRTQVCLHTEIKSHGDTLDSGSLIAGLSCWFLRSIQFTAIQTGITRGRKFEDCLPLGKGVTASTPAEIGVPDPHILVTDVFSRSAAKAFVESTLAQYRGEK